MPLSRKQHPLQTIEGSVLWRTVEKQIASFVRNGDMQELTAREIHRRLNLPGNRRRKTI
jgi:hypothetical protein